MSLQEILFSLEQALLHTDWSDQQEKLELMLAEEFSEINPAGSVISRADVIQWLLQKNPEHRWEFTPGEVIELGNQSVLLTYHARQAVPENSGSKGSRHISLWHSNIQGDWQMRFHQSTRIQ